MKKNILFTFLLAFLLNTLAFSQCSYNLINVTHVDCYNDNTGKIEISITNSNSTWSWVLADGSTSTSSILNNLAAGPYVLNIAEYFVPGDPTTTEICSISDTIWIEQTIEITADFVVNNMCSSTDSADIYTTIIGGTRPYSTLWIQTGDTSRNITNVAPSIIVYVLSITDANGCQQNDYITVKQVESLQTFMYNDDVICKDDNSGTASVFVENGTAPYVFTWDNGEEFLDENSSKIEDLYPGTYGVSIKDTFGCTILDSITIASDPKICINIYKVFSPNEDGIHDYWEIENIHLYPEALVEVYDRMGNMVFRRRNYINADGIAFNGFSTDGRRLPSSTYYFVLNLELEEEVFKGTLTIVR